MNSIPGCSIILGALAALLGLAGWVGLAPATQEAQMMPTMVIIVTATPMPMPEPTEALLPPTWTPVLPTAAPTEAPEDDGCLRHTVEPGDTIFAIAQAYGVFVGDLLLANGLGENDLLHVGDVLLIPVEGCDWTAPAPTPALNTEIEIIDSQFMISVSGAGDLTTEAVEIRNLGTTVDVTGWELRDADGNTFVFPELRLFSGSLVRLFSRQGQNTPVALFWGRDAPVWSAGETALLVDASGAVQAADLIGE